MGRYRYKAVSASGDLLENEMDADNETAVIDRLHASGLLPIRITAAGGSAFLRLLTEDLSRRAALSPRELGIFARQLSMLLHAGVPLDRALEILAELAGRDHARKIMAQVLDRVRGGAALGDALAGVGEVFPGYLVSLVRAGEAGGSLDDVLARVADYAERQQALRDNLRSALLYPTIVLALAGVSLVVMFTFVLPQFEPVFAGAGAELPTITRWVMGLGEFFRNQGWIVLLVLTLLLLVGQRQARRPQARVWLDAAMLRLPLLGDLVVRVATARVSRTLGTLLANGVVLVSALGIARDTAGNAVIARALDDTMRDLKEGQGLAEPLRRSGTFPALAIHLIRVGEEAGRLDDMLLKVADIFDHQVQQTIERFLALLVPAVTIALGGFVAVIIGSILMAILSVYELAV